MRWLYLALNLATISIPLLWSFGSKMKFYKKWKALWLAIFVVGILFIWWDIYFTKIGIWGFNPTYYLGVHWSGLPIEEMLFFVCIPYACVFTYEALNYYLKSSWRSIEVYLSAVLISTLLAIGIANMDKWYTSVTFIALAATIWLMQFFFKVNYLGKFYRTYLVILIPFFIVNGILTGTAIPNEVVWYNDSHNLQVRLGTIPVEDVFYGMLLILLNVVLYEVFKKYWVKK